jgi:hypothetical protein
VPSAPLLGPRWPRRGARSAALDLHHFDLIGQGTRTLRNQTGIGRLAKLQVRERTRDSAMSNLARKLRGCDVVRLKSEDVARMA